jgi:hypothetical protein
VKMSKSVVRYEGSMDGAVNGLEDTNLIEPPWLEDDGVG